jgi:peptidoglycan/LPS O-acetylase OafA/YrhL
MAVVPYDMAVVTGFAQDRPFVWFNTGLLAVICAITVFIGSFDKGYTFPDCQLKKVLIYVGTRSYALYLAHNPSYFATREIFRRIYPDAVFDHRFILPFVCVAAILSFGAAELTFRFVETPLRRLGRKKAAEYRALNPLRGLADQSTLNSPATR